MGKFVDLTGNRYGKLSVIGRTEDYISPKGYVSVNRLCQCDCGNLTVVRGCNLKSGASTSCGCERVVHPNRLRHGDTHTRLHGIWKNMRRRCYNPSDSNYKDYGARGIKVCAQWFEYEVFRDWSLANGYNDSLTIDRIDYDGDYSPDNCRWADKFTQANNTRGNHFLEYNGEIHTIAEWSRITGIPYHRLKDRINKLGWDIERALTT